MEGTKSEVLCASGGGCETRLSCDSDGCVEVLSAARGRALVTGRNTVLPFSVHCVGHLMKDNYKVERLTNTRAHVFAMAQTQERFYVMV